MPSNGIYAILTPRFATPSTSPFVNIPVRKSRVALALLYALPAAAYAESAQQGLKLRMQPSLVGLPGAASDSNAPLYMEADRVQGYGDQETEAFGNARARSRGRAFSADWLRFDQRDNELTAIGNVHFEPGAYVVDGLRLRYGLDTERGVMESARFSLSPRTTGNLPFLVSGGTETRAAPTFDGRGAAERILFEGPGQFRAQQASFTTCEPGNDGWQLRSQDLQIYQDKGVGIARNATVDFEGTPIFYTPYLSFPLHQERKSGFLTPHYGSTSTSGFEVSVPYFWNLAPNYDLTVTPRPMSKRGLQLRSEFRYLQPEYRGNFYYEVLPDDRLSDSSRQLLTLKHTQTLWTDWTAVIDLNKVSDAKYFTDLSTSVALTSQTNLVRQASLSRGGAWGNSGTYAFNALIQGWQTLQTDPLAPLTPPYSRRPQLSLTAQNSKTLGGDFDFLGSYADFYHPTLARGKRLMAYPSLSFPWQSAGAYVTPKIGVHMTRYFMDPNTSGLADASRVVPTFTVLSGLTFERNANIFGSDYIQTLEPKAYYVYIPFRDQSRLPNFESGLLDINFATIFTENQFSGQDRINNANHLTLGGSSRLINPKNGFEVLRASLAQRYYFSAQQISLPGVPPPNNQSSRSDLMAALSGSVAPNLTANAGWQYTADTNQTQSSSLSLRYQPQQGKVLNLAYRQNVNSAIRQFDLSGQWPIASHWNAVGRWNYSVLDKRMLEGLAGMEYDGGCYVFRIVAHRLSTATTAANTSIFLELELNGMTRVGSNSLDLLRRNVSGYTRNDPYASRMNEYSVPER